MCSGRSVARALADIAWMLASSINVQQPFSCRQAWWAQQSLARRSAILAAHAVDTGSCSNSRKARLTSMAVCVGSSSYGSAVVATTGQCKLSAIAQAEPAAAAPPASATAATATATARATPMPQYDVQQQLLQQAAAQVASCCNTQLLTIDSPQLPPVATPDAAAVQQILSAAEAPDLSPNSCPHLYYTMPAQHGPTHSNSMAHSGAMQQQSLAVLQQAAELLQQDLPVAIPTETVYGLAANALSAPAVAHIFRAKGRPSDNPLIVHISDLDMLYKLYPDHIAAGTNPIPQQYHRLIAAFWPGPLTILLPASPLIPAAVTAGQPTVAVRMPAHPTARALIAAAGVPLAAPSANTSGRPSPTTAQHVLEDLNGRIPAVVDGGACGFGVESTVLDGLRVPPVVLRPGGVTAEQLAESPQMEGLQVYSRDFTDKALETRPTTPGMKYRHYSPTAPVLLLDPALAWQTLQEQYDSTQEQQKQAAMQQLSRAMDSATEKLLEQLWQHEQAGRVVLLSTCRCCGSKAAADAACGWTADSMQQLQCFDRNGTALPRAAPDRRCSPRAASSGSPSDLLEYVLGSVQRPDTVAKELFGALRAADGVGCDVIVVQGVLPVGTGMAVMNRLQKAASQRHHVDL